MLRYKNHYKKDLILDIQKRIKILRSLDIKKTRVVILRRHEKLLYRGIIRLLGMLQFLFRRKDK